ncbi:MAG TPA: Maf family protein [Steroidobacteraceae bacterium]|nr:Maf family protein [Steroidobacteraceae bacterium]
MTEPTAPLLVLASASPRRSELLHQIGVAHRVEPADIDETRKRGEDIDECVQRLARSKALQVQQRLKSLPVLGADTIVVVDDALLGKPRDRADGIEMLRRLSGRSHQVLSAVVLASDRGLHQGISRNVVRFRALSEQECAAYWDSGEPQGKAGAYAIQGLGAVFIEYLSGSYSGVMGLPLYETAQLLKAVGIEIPGPMAR